MALKTFTAGEVLTADDVNTYLVNTIVARKSATESVLDSSTYQDDDDLSVSVAANSTYEFTLALRYDASTTGDIKFQLVGPAGSTIEGVMVKNHASASSTTDVTVKEYSGAESAAGLGAGTTMALEVIGLAVIAGTAGTFKLQWAQNVADAAVPTRVFSNSYICLRRVE